jgi:minor extracellular serine protease Vpr
MRRRLKRPQTQARLSAAPPANHRGPSFSVGAVLSRTALSCVLGLLGFRRLSRNVPTAPTAHLARRILAAVTAAAAILLLAGTVQGAGESALRATARAWHSVFGNRPAMRPGERRIVVLSAPSIADRVATSETPPSAEQERQWAADIEGIQRTLLTGLSQRGIDVERDFVYTRVLDGFSAVLDGRAIAELERNPLVVGIYPVRAVYPAQTSGSRGPGVGSGIALPGYDGRGVHVALLDTGVDRTDPDLRGRVRHGFDLVSDDALTAPEANPSDPAELELHGTRMAGLVLSVAPRARILPFRVLGWTATESGYAVVGRGDRLIAGLERAVDPNGDSVTKDAAAVALAPVVEPFAAFADSPESRAVTGATALGTLVVAPTGNDGDGGVGFGRVGAPGAAADALSVGAVDTRTDVLESTTRLTVGGDSVLDEPARLLGPAGTRRNLVLQVVGLLGPSLAEPARGEGDEAGGSRLADFFDTKGVSRVAGRAVLVPADGTSLARKAENAKAAGAAALLVYATDLPAGVLELGDNAVPVVAIPAEAGRRAVDGLRAGEEATVSLAASTPVGNGTAGRVAAFSSGGLAFDGRVRPDVVAPGVGLATDEAVTALGARFATATGTSAAAAVAAGAAALVKQARPALSASELRSALVGSASTLRERVTREGAGVVDPAAAAAADLVVTPATLAFGRATSKAWSETRNLTVKNVSSRALRVGFGYASDVAGPSVVTFTAEPARLNLGPGASAEVTLGVQAPAGVGNGITGVVVASATGARPARIPWAIAPRPARNALVMLSGLSDWEFRPSKSAPTVVAFQAGRVVDAGAGEAIEPLGILDLELWTARGKKLGILARLRDLLPGRYAFGLTGRDPNGKILPPGTYVLRLRAQPVDAEDGAPPSTVQTVFRIKEPA